MHNTEYILANALNIVLWPYNILEKMLKYTKINKSIAALIMMAAIIIPFALIFLPPFFIWGFSKGIILFFLGLIFLTFMFGALCMIIWCCVALCEMFTYYKEKFDTSE